MGVQGIPVEHPSDDTKVQGRILDRRMVKVFYSIDNSLAERSIRKLTYHTAKQYVPLQ